MTMTFRASAESWPIAGTFVIARSAVTAVTVVVAEISDGHHAGRGECRPYDRYDETPESVLAAIAAVDPADLDRARLRHTMPPGAARNALDCALWDLAAKQSGMPVWRLAGLAEPQPATTAFTLSLGSPQSMAEAAGAATERPLLKVKLGGDGDTERIRAIRAAVPDAQLMVDANEAWNAANFATNMAACADAGVLMIEQPLPADDDALLAGAQRPVPVFADESVHVAADLAGLAGKYDGVNIKLDKAGGLTEALALHAEARRTGFRIMAGCMVSTSLSMAPAFLLAQGADFVDLDGPLILARDRSPGLSYSGARVEPPPAALWG